VFYVSSVLQLNRHIYKRNDISIHTQQYLSSFV